MMLPQETELKVYLNVELDRVKIVERLSNNLIINEFYNMSWVLYIDLRTLAVEITGRS
jgi:hypothetical protein